MVADNQRSLQVSETHNSTLIVRIVWVAVLLGLVFAGIIFILLSVMPFHLLKPFADAIPKDGNFESFTANIHSQLAFLKWVGIVFLGLSGWLPEQRFNNLLGA